MSDEQTPEDNSPEGEEHTEEPGDSETSSDEIKAEPRGAGEGKPVRETSTSEVTGRSPVGIIVTVIIALAIVAIGIWAAMGMLKPEPGELLQETVASYQQAEQIHVESTMSYERSMGEQQQDIEMPTAAWFSRPNRMSFVSGDEMQKTAAVSDGEHLYLEIGMLPGVIKLPAPQSLAEMPLDNLSVSAATGAVAITLPDIASLLSGAFEAGNLQNLQYGIAEDEEWLGTLEGPEDAWVLTGKPASGPTVAIWIDKGRRLIRKFATDIDYDAMLEATPELADQIQTLPEDRQEMLRQMVTRIEVDVTNVQLGEPAPEGTFAYQPGEGTEVVEAQTIEEGVQKLMAAAMGQQGMPGGPPPIADDGATDQPPAEE